MNRLLFSMLRPAQPQPQTVITGKVTILSGLAVAKTVRLEQRRIMADNGTLLAESPITGGRYTITLPASFKVDTSKIYVLVVVGDNCTQTIEDGTEIRTGLQIDIKSGEQYVHDLFVKGVFNTYTVQAMAIGELRSRASVFLTIPRTGRTKMSISVDSPYIITLLRSDFVDGDVAKIRGEIRINNQEIVGTASIVLKYDTYEYSTALRMTGITPTDPFDPSGPSIKPGELMPGGNGNIL